MYKIPQTLNTFNYHRIVKSLVKVDGFPSKAVEGLAWAISESIVLSKRRVSTLSSLLGAVYARESKK